MDVASGEILVDKTHVDARNLIENMSMISHQFTLEEI